MADRKAELEKKRKKLDELRKARELNKKKTTDKEPLPKSPAKSPDPLARERENVDKLVTDLIGGSTLSPSQAAAVAVATKSPDGVKSKPEIKEPSASLIPRAKPVKLVLDVLAPINIKAKEVEVYAKQTQTEAAALGRGAEEEEAEDLELAAEPVNRQHKTSDKAAQDTEREKTPLSAHRELSGEQLDRILVSDDFSAFIDRASCLVERALCDSKDILFDFISNQDEEGGEGLSSMRVVKRKVFHDERWTQNRAVNAMDWSAHHPDLLLVSYHVNPNIPHDPDGVALLWDLKFPKKTPDYIFNCQSPIMSVAFSQFHPSYVLGGTYSGQIMLWDTRSGKRTPVQRSPLSSSAHTHPVYCMEVVGSQNAHNLITVSTDGKLCSWNLDMLSQPQEHLELQNRQTRPAAVTCLSFPSNDVNKFLVGSEECAVYQGQRHGTKPGLSVQFDGHYGPVTAVSCHRAAGGQVDLSHLFLTASFDWTLKLWSSKLLNEQQLTSKTGQPICSLENNSEYVYDVQWSPVHPAIFASGDGEGRLDLWNLNEDTEIPILSETVEASLCKLRWSPNGQHLACGDSEGRVHIYDTGEGLHSPHADEWSKLQQTLVDLQETTETASLMS